MNSSRLSSSQPCSSWEFFIISYVQNKHAMQCLWGQHSVAKKEKMTICQCWQTKKVCCASHTSHVVCRFRFMPIIKRERWWLESRGAQLEKQPGCQLQNKHWSWHVKRGSDRWIYTSSEAGWHLGTLCSPVFEGLKWTVKWSSMKWSSTESQIRATFVIFSHSGLLIPWI